MRIKYVIPVVFKYLYMNFTYSLSHTIWNNIVYIRLVKHINPFNFKKIYNIYYKMFL